MASDVLIWSDAQASVELGHRVKPSVSSMPMDLQRSILCSWGGTSHVLAGAENAVLASLQNSVQRNHGISMWDYVNPEMHTGEAGTTGLSIWH